MITKEQKEIEQNGRKGRGNLLWALRRKNVLGWKMNAQRVYAQQSESVKDKECKSEGETQRWLFIRAKRGINDI